MEMTSSVKFTTVAGLVLALLLMPLPASAQNTPPEAAATDSKPAVSLLLRKRFEKFLRKALPQHDIVSIRKSELEGFYSVQMTRDFSLQLSEKADYMMVGDLYKIDASGISNLSESQRSAWRANQLRQLRRNEMVIFSPRERKTQAAVYIFTDVDCGYCRRLHQLMSGYHDYGIEVRYLAYPRAGVGSATYNKMVSAWCSTNKRQKMSELKAGQSIKNRLCVDNPVAEQFELGSSLGVKGTPAIFTESGKLISGFLPPEELARELGVF